MSAGQRLDAVCELTMGQAPIGESYNSVGHGLPLIAGAGDFGEGHPVVKKFTTDPGKVCAAGDIVLGIRASIGEKVIADREYCLGRGVAGLRARAGLEPRYLWHWLTHVAPVLSAKAKGATFKQVTREDIGELKIVLPSLAEQRRIAGILDKADALRAKRRAALTHLDTLTQSIFVDMFGDTVTNPKGWPWMTLDEIGRFIRGITFKPDDVVSPAAANSVACMRTRNVQSELDLSDTWWVSERFVKRDDQFLRAGDILVSSANSWNLVGKCCWIPQLPMRATFGGFVSVLRADHTKVYPEVLFTWFRSQRVQSLVRSFGQQTTNISNLNIQRTLALRFPLPSFNAQRAFCSAVEAERKVKASQLLSASRLDTLFASLQYRAFRGEL